VGVEEYMTQIEKQFWDHVATKRVYAAFDRDEYGSVFDRTDLRIDGQYCLDIGCASGVSSALLSARGGIVYGIDLSPNLIAQAQGLWPGIDFSVGDAEYIQFPDNKVALAFFGGVLHHFPDRRRVLSEAHRVLKSGGSIVAIEPNLLDVMERIEWLVAGWRGKLTPDEYPINPYDLVAELEQVGFGNVEFYTIRHDIPVLAQLPVLRRFFSRQKGTRIKRVALDVLNRFRRTDQCGTFFVINGRKL
jgi:2-polyprenyl-6-hydroxyphenyl methylase/3-demethylubiquinone-9 3-methyltransferase